MDRTADKSTPQIPEATGFRLPWREALKRAGSFDELRPYLHMGQIPAHHGGLYALPDSNQHSGPGILRPEKWAHAYEDRAERRVIFITDEVVFEQFVRERVFAYDISIELDRAAFDTFFPVAGLPPAEHPRPLTTQAEPAPSSAPKKRSRKKAAPKKRSRKKAVYQSSQTVRARAVLDRIFPDKNYPTKGLIPWPELLDMFSVEYELYVKDNSSKLYAKTSPTKKLSMPSERTIRRALGWE